MLDGLTGRGPQFPRGGGGLPGREIAPPAGRVLEASEGTAQLARANQLALVARTVSRLGGSGKVAFGKRAVERVELLGEREYRPATNLAKLGLGEYL